MTKFRLWKINRQKKIK